MQTRFQHIVVDSISSREPVAQICWAFTVFTLTVTNSWKGLFCLLLRPCSGARLSEVLFQRPLLMEPRNAAWFALKWEDSTCVSLLPQSVSGQSIIWSHCCCVCRKYCEHSIFQIVLMAKVFVCSVSFLLYWQIESPVWLKPEKNCGYGKQTLIR